MKSLKAPGIKAPNASIMVSNILKSGSEDGLTITLTPGSEKGLDRVAKKYGYGLELTNTRNVVTVRMTKVKGEEIDVTGETCPGPVIMVGERLKTMAVGDRIKVKNTSKESIDDIAVSASGMSGKIIAQGTEGDRHFVIIEKGEKTAVMAGIDRDKVLVVQSNGIGNAERAYATFIFSKAALSMGKPVTIFMLMDGVSIARKGNAATVKHPAFERLDKLMAEVIQAGAQVFVCELSATFRNMKQPDLVDGAKLAGAATFITLLSDPAFAIVNF
jgi:predicted peroxiredoxin/TusA-related sulfurtransferase